MHGWKALTTIWRHPGIRGMDVLVINLMRLGDIIQSGPVVRRLKAEYPGARVTYLVMDIFRGVAELLRGVDRLVALPTLKLAEALDRDGWPGAYRQLYGWCEEHFRPGPELVVNLTPTLMGGALAFSVGAREVRGFVVDRERQIFTRPAWASYSLVVSKARNANPFNLVDLFLKGAGLSPDGRGLEVRVPPEAVGQVEAAISALSLPENMALVGLFPGASRPERQWPTANFAAAARALLASRPCHFFIFGSAGERALGEAVGRELEPARVSLCLGETTPAQLAAYLARLDLLITNDTGPMHLAAAVGTRVLALFLASARAHDTGPAGVGHVTLESRLECHPCLTPCSHPRCHEVISPEAVAALALAMLGKGKVDWQKGARRGQHLRIYRSGTDPQGCQALFPLGRRALGRLDFWVWVHRSAWARMLDRGAGAGGEMAAWIKGHLAEAYLAPEEDLQVEEGRRVLKEVCRLAALGMAEADGIRQSAEGGAMAPARLRQRLKCIEDIDGSLKRLSLEFSEAAAFIEFFFQEQRREGGQDAAVLAQSLVQAYGVLRELAAGSLMAMENLAGNLPDQVRQPGCAAMAHDVQDMEVDNPALQPHSEEWPCM